MKEYNRLKNEFNIEKEKREGGVISSSIIEWQKLILLKTGNVIIKGVHGKNDRVEW